MFYAMIFCGCLWEKEEKNCGFERFAISQPIDLIIAMCVRRLRQQDKK